MSDIYFPLREDSVLHLLIALASYAFFEIRRDAFHILRDDFMGHFERRQRAVVDRKLTSSRQELIERALTLILQLLERDRWVNDGSDVVSIPEDFRRGVGSLKEFAKGKVTRDAGDASRVEQN